MATGRALQPSVRTRTLRPSLGSSTSVRPPIRRQQRAIHLNPIYKANGSLNKITASFVGFFGFAAVLALYGSLTYSLAPAEQVQKEEGEIGEWLNKLGPEKKQRLEELRKQFIDQHTRSEDESKRQHEQSVIQEAWRKELYNTMKREQKRGAGM